jgi:aspartate kinase
MSRILVLKFGGTSLAGMRRVHTAARRVRAHVCRGRAVVTVVSAAGRATDRILDCVTQLCDPAAAAACPPEMARGVARELDRALATGEDRSAALLAAALCRLGVRARSLHGGEAGITAAGDFGAGTIAHVDPQLLRELIGAAVVPVVSGFQGVRRDGETVTLGRGGSDTTAVALAAALGAECHIITDVDAVYDRDPRSSPGASRFAALDHAALLQLVAGGAGVVHVAAARLAAAAGVELRVYHHRAPVDGAGTRVGGGRPARAVVAGHGGRQPFAASGGAV